MDQREYNVRACSLPEANRHRDINREAFKIRWLYCGQGDDETEGD